MAKQKKAKRLSKRIKHDSIVGIFAKKLLELRRDRGLKQSELAKLAEINVTYVTRLEKGISAPGIDLVQRLAKALEVSIHDLLPADTQDPTGLLQKQVRQRFESIMLKADSSTLRTLAPWLALLDDELSRRKR